MNCALGIDLGTSGVKTVLFDEMGHILLTASRTYPLICQEENYAEQNPTDWWTATKETIQEITRQCDSSSIKGIGISGQMHGLVLLNKKYQPLRNSILWCDNRSLQECIDLENDIGVEQLVKITGNRALPAFTISKLLWMKNHERNIYNRIIYISLPKDFIRLMLTGQHGIELSDASGTQLLDLRDKTWSNTLFRYLGLPISALGEIYDSDENCGYVLPDVAHELGLSAETIVVGGAGDQAAAALGNGVNRSGQINCSLGSSGVVYTPLKSFKSDITGKVQTFMDTSGQSFVMGVTQGCGISMKWIKDLFYRDDEHPYQQIEKEIAPLAIGSDNLIFLPYLLGERTPHLDPAARGVFFGLNVNHQRCHMARAVMEGITFSLRDGYDIIAKMSSRPESLVLSGGGTANETWCQMIADVINIPVIITNSQEAGALGVAMLVFKACGVYENLDEAIEAMVTKNKVYRPIKSNYRKYLPYYQLYKRLYVHLKDDYRLLKECAL